MKVGLEGGHPRVPGRAECERLLDLYGVPPHIRRHSEQVARVALHLSRALRRQGATLDLGLLEAAALLHDISKAACLASHRDHAREGGEVLRREGYGSVAALLERHVELGAWDPEGPVTEAEVLNYSDKRVRHDEVVTLAERFEDLVIRYGSRHPGAEARIRCNWDVTRALERKIFGCLPFGPGEL